MYLINVPLSLDPPDSKNLSQVPSSLSDILLNITLSKLLILSMIFIIYIYILNVKHIY